MKHCVLTQIHVRAVKETRDPGEVICEVLGGGVPLGLGTPYQKNPYAFPDSLFSRNSFYYESCYYSRCNDLLRKILSILSVNGLLH